MLNRRDLILGATGLGTIAAAQTLAAVQIPDVPAIKADMSTIQTDKDFGFETVWLDPDKRSDFPMNIYTEKSRSSYCLFYNEYDSIALRKDKFMVNIPYIYILGSSKENLEIQIMMMKQELLKRASCYNFRTGPMPTTEVVEILGDRFFIDNRTSSLIMTRRKRYYRLFTDILADEFGLAILDCNKVKKV